MAAAMESLESHRIFKMPPTAYYIPEYITEEEEKFLLKEVDASPKPKWTQLSHRRLQNWGGLPHPKGMVPEKLPEWLSVYVNKVAELGIFREKKPNHVLVNEYLPGQGIMPHEDGPLFYPVITTINLGSHALLDYYQQVERNDADVKEQQGYYQDMLYASNMNPKFYIPLPTCSIVDIDVLVTALDERYIGSVLLKPRSLLIVKDDLYHNYLHGIREVTEDPITDKVFNRTMDYHDHLGKVLPRDRRISLTIRHVPKTLNVCFKIGR